MKKVKILLAVVVAMLGLATFCTACSSSEISRININWGISLPEMEIEYSYSDAGWFGDGVYYYVCNTDKSALGVDFTKDETGQVEEIIAYNSALLENIDGNYFIDCSHNLELYRLTENDGNDSLNLIYDGDITRLIILEIHT